MQRLQEKYIKEIAPALQKEFGLKNPLAVPKIKRIVLNVGVGKVFRDSKQIESIVADLGRIAGQRPVTVASRTSIAGFKMREGQIVGVKVTLRGEKMWSFLDKLVNIGFPRVRDFRGVSPKGFDGMGNYHLGLKEQIVFSEVPQESVSLIFGFQVSIVTDAGENEKALKLLKAFGFPFAS
jgi:large subunit ribosomal protein L5